MSPYQHAFSHLFGKLLKAYVHILLLVICTAGAATFEALLFSKIGQLVDWLSKSQPESFLSQHASNILILISVLFAKLFVNIQSIINIRFYIALFQCAYVGAFTIFY